MAATVKTKVDTHIDKAIAEFRQSDVVIASLATNYMPLTIAGVDDRKGYLAVRAARIEVKQLRVSVEHKRVELKEDALKYGKAVDTEANRLKALIKPIEDHLQKQEDEYEAAKEQLRNEKIEAEQAALQKRIDRLTAARCPIADVSFLKGVDDANFELFFEKAVETQLEKERLEKIEADRVEAELAAAAAERERIAEEQKAELRQQQEANRIEAERLKAEQERQSQANRVERERMDAERAELNRQAEELRAREDADRRRVEAENDERIRRQAEALKAEEDRLAAIAQAEAEAAEAARLEALKPEIEKAESFTKLVMAYSFDMLIGLGKPSWAGLAMQEIESACNQIKMIVGNQ